MLPFHTRFRSTVGSHMTKFLWTYFTKYSFYYCLHTDTVVAFRDYETLPWLNLKVKIVKVPFSFFIMTSNNCMCNQEVKPSIRRFFRSLRKCLSVFNQSELLVKLCQQTPFVTDLSTNEVWGCMS